MMVIQQLRVFFLGIINIFRRALCCFSRRRKHSFSMNDTLQTIDIVVDDNKYTSRQKFQGPERDWNSWDDSPRTVEEHIEQYRQNLIKPTTPPKEEAEPDFFSGLAPVIKPQMKYFLGNDSQKTDFSRLEAKSDVPIAINADLEDWTDEINGDWEEGLDSQQARDLIREKRREIRNQRQKGYRTDENFQNLINPAIQNKAVHGT